MQAPAGFIKRASARVRCTLQGRRLERVMVRGRAVRRASERLERVHATGLLAGGGAAVGLALLSALLGAAEPSRAATERPDRVPLAISAELSPAQDVARRGPQRGGGAHYRRTTSRHVGSSAEAGFLPLYREAARTFGVSWRLIASIHRQETAFSTVPGTYHGLNAFGCCAGPMQFNLKNGPVSTWELYRGSFRLGERPHRYPHRTRRHPSVYDDFDAIMAAGALLRDSGASGLLDGGSWSAAYAYYGHDLFGVGYASEVVARAQSWELNGFCLNCPADAAIVAVLDDAYGVDARRQLRAAERRRKDKKHKRHKTQQRRAVRKQADGRADRREQPPRRPAPGREPVATTPRPAPAIAPTTTTEAPPTPQAVPVPPVEQVCTPVARLLGCRD